MTAIYQINSGGDDESPFVADEFYSETTGGTSEFDNAIDLSGATDPAPEHVYQTERYGPMLYTLPSLTPAATYKVRLHFAEIYAGTSFAGGRQFDVSIQGTAVLTNYDIYVEAGNEANKAVIEDFDAVADGSGNVLIRFSVGAADNPKISAIELLSSGGGGGSLIDVVIGPLVVTFGDS